MLLVDREGLALAVDIASANRNEVTLIEPLSEQRVLHPAPEHQLYDQAADSDPLRKNCRCSRSNWFADIDPIVADVPLKMDRRLAD